MPDSSMMNSFLGESCATRGRQLRLTVQEDRRGDIRGKRGSRH